MTDTRTLLITGATGALGESVATTLAGSGHRLMLTGRNGARLEEMAKAIDSPGLDFVVEDATQEQGAQRAVRQAVERFGGVDGLVHLVGGFRVGPVAMTGPETYEAMFHANTVSAITATKAVLPSLGPGGRLVYVSSVLASEPFPGFGAYAASKAALQAWVRALAHEVKNLGIHANTVVMTMADTPDARRDRPHMDFDQATKPDEVAKVIDFLAGPGSDGLYGSTIPVLGRFGFSTPLAAPPPGRR